MKFNKVLFVGVDRQVVNEVIWQYGCKFQTEFANDSEEALDLINSTVDPYAVVVTSMTIESLVGIDFLRRVQNLTPNSICLLLTDCKKLQVIHEAINDGYVHRFLPAPVDPFLLSRAVQDALEQFNLMQFLKSDCEPTNPKLIAAGGPNQPQLATPSSESWARNVDELRDVPDWEFLCCPYYLSHLVMFNHPGPPINREVIC